MREIKFRARDKKNELWIVNSSVVHIEVNNPKVYHLHQDGSYYDNESCKEHEIILMQFTGLKDKNGKEIYEGDIVATSNDGKDGCDLWSEGDFGFQEVILDTLYGVNMGGWSWDDEQSVYNIKYIEVIGNIYENENLLDNNSGIGRRIG
jgi:uncharacterized phage protein (TIGR01671 family)